MSSLLRPDRRSGKPFREIFAFLPQHRALWCHAILLSVAGAMAVSCYSLTAFQSISLSDLFEPSVVYLRWWGLWIGILYTSWLLSGFLLSALTHRRLSDALERDCVCYLPLILSIASVLKHVGIPARLGLLPAIVGCITLKVGLLGDPRWYLPWLPRGRHLDIWLVAVATTGYAVTFAVLSGLRVYTFQTYGDFALFVQQIWGFSQFRLLFSTHAGMNLGGHVSPALFLLGPIYRIFQSPITLCVVQSVALALGALPVYWMARDRFRSSWIGVSFCIAYLLYPAVQLPNLGDFHESLLVTAPLLFALYFLRLREYNKALPFTLLSLFCKEDVAIIICMLGLYIFFLQRNRLMGSAYIALGMLWFTIAVRVIAPTFQSTQSFLYFTYYPALKTLAKGIHLSVTDLLVDTATFAFTPTKIVYIAELLTPFGWLAILAPSTLILAVPTLLEILLYDGPPFGMVATIASWHVAALVPLMVTAAIEGAWWLSQWSGTQRLLRWLTPDSDTSSMGRFLIVEFMFLSSIGSSILFGAVPYTPSFDFSNFTITPHARVGHELLKLIPPNAALTATSQMAGYVSHREYVYQFPNPFVVASWVSTSRLPGPVEYVIVDTSRASVMKITASQREGFMEEVRRLSRNPDYSTFASRDGYVIFRRTKQPSDHRQWRGLQE